MLKTCSRSFDSFFLGFCSGEPINDDSELDLVIDVDFWCFFTLVNKGFFFRAWKAGITDLSISSWLPGIWSLLMVGTLFRQCSSSVRSRPQTTLLSLRMFSAELAFYRLGFLSSDCCKLTTDVCTALLLIETAVATLSKAISCTATYINSFLDLLTQTFAVIDGFLNCVCMNLSFYSSVKPERKLSVTAAQSVLFSLMRSCGSSWR